MLKCDAINRNAFVLFAALPILMLWTSCMLPLTLDEGNSIARADKIAKWVTFFWNRPAEISSPFVPEVIQKYCEQTTQTEGHPAGYVLLIAAGNSLAKTTRLDCLIDEKTCYRFGPILLFCLAVTAVYVRMGQTFGQRTAIFCVLCILFIPRVFAHAHIAVCDSPLMSCWLLAWALFEPALKSTRGAIFWGIAIGLGFSMKFPGWIIPIPFLAFAALELIRKRPTDSIARAFALGFPTAVFLFYLLNPTLWYTPIDSFLDFVYLNTHRAKSFNVPSFFLGKVYHLTRPLPWYNTLVWAGITIPTGLLFFLVCLGISSLRKSSADFTNTIERNRLILLVILNFLPLMIVRAIPGTPVHHGVRLFVAAFPFVGILAGLGASVLWGTIRAKHINQEKTLVNENLAEQSNQSARPRFLLIRRILVVIILFGSGFNLYWYGPQWLSYYNLCIGGLPGAVRSGMEATYYWDSFDDETMNWLNSHLDRKDHDPSPDQVLFHRCSYHMLATLHRWKKIQSGTNLSPIITPDAQWFVIQHLECLLHPIDKKLIQETKPAYRKIIPRRGPGPWNLCEVPLLEIYDIRDFMAIVKSFESETDKKNSKPAQWTPW